jgi:hypothetical protein
MQNEKLSTYFSRLKAWEEKLSALRVELCAIRSCFSHRENPPKSNIVQLSKVEQASSLFIGAQAGSLCHRKYCLFLK